ncbi:MAG: hypothetical protein HY812_03540 [Planctomycetes bacterium]|nr:hypothetical protein [Planctomycetota bacterium]
MPTERDVLRKIVGRDREGLKGLFERHGALFREGLVRFYGKADVEAAPRLARVVQSLAADLRAGRFVDLVETFYNWVFRATWTALVSMRMEEAGGGHIDPETFFQCADPLNEAALPEETRQQARSHFESCGLCRDLLEKTKGVPVQVRHAGAPFPADFSAVIQAALEKIDP